MTWEAELQYGQLGILQFLQFFFAINEINGRTSKVALTAATILANGENFIGAVFEVFGVQFSDLGSTTTTRALRHFLLPP
jgi:hypothetical protein